MKHYIICLLIGVLGQLICVECKAQVLQLDGIIAVRDCPIDETYFRASLYAALVAEGHNEVFQLKKDGYQPMVIVKIYDYQVMNVYCFNLVIFAANNGVAYSFRDFYRNGKPCIINTQAQKLVAYYTKELRDHLLNPIKPVSLGN